MSPESSVGNVKTETEYKRKCPLCSHVERSPERALCSFQLVRCAHCRFVFVDITRAQADAANDWSDGSIARYEERQSRLASAIDARVARRLAQAAPEAPRRLLDFGCGKGDFLVEARKKGWDVVGVEGSDWGKYAAKEHGLDIRSCLDNAGFRDGEFSVIHSNAVGEHLYDPLMELARLKPLLATGGICYFRGIPNYDSLSIRLGVSKFYHNEPPKHINYFDPHSARTLFEQAGFARTKVQTYGVDLVWAFDWLTIWLKNRRSRQDKHQDIPGGRPSSLQDSAEITWLTRAIIGAYWHCGVAGLGSKLEIEAYR